MDHRITELYGEYTNGMLDRGAFLKRLAVLVGGTAAAYALLPLLEGNDVEAEVIPKDDPRLHTEYIEYTGEDGKPCRQWAKKQ